MDALFTMAAMQFYSIAILSMLLHGVKKWAYREIRGNVIDWYIEHPRASVGALMACTGGIAAALLSGGISDPSQGAHVLAAAGIGFSSDTLNNQGKK